LAIFAVKDFEDLGGSRCRKRLRGEDVVEEDATSAVTRDCALLVPDVLAEAVPFTALVDVDADGLTFSLFSLPSGLLAFAPGLEDVVAFSCAFAARCCSCTIPCQQCQP
jgi:hypothetical protein